MCSSKIYYLSLSSSRIIFSILYKFTNIDFLYGSIKKCRLSSQSFSGATPTFNLISFLFFPEFVPAYHDNRDGRTASFASKNTIFIILFLLSIATPIAEPKKASATGTCFSLISICHFSRKITTYTFVNFLTKQCSRNELPCC